MKGNSYKLISSYYDTIKHFVLANDPIAAETFFLKDLPKEKSLLVVACGTAEFLNHINTEYFDQIVCLDANKGMISLAQKRIKSLKLKRHILFKESRFEDFQSDTKFDIIALPFVLDCLKQKDQVIFLNKANELLNDSGNLIITDFQYPERKWDLQRFFIVLMYAFFKLSTNIQSTRLPDYDSILKNKWVLQEEYILEKFNIFSKKYKKSAF